MTKLQLAIFDCDGTLVDSQHAIVRAMTDAFVHANVEPPSREEILKVVGLPLRGCVEVLLPSGSDELIDRVAEGYREVFRVNREKGQDEPPLYPGTMELLEELHRAGVLLAIATGKSRRGLTHTMKVHGLNPLFVDSKTADDGPGKPNPDILFDLMETWRVRPESCCMIGDTTFDIEMGVNAKMKSFGVSWGYHSPAMLEGAGAASISDSWSELLAVLRQNFEF